MSSDGLMGDLCSPLETTSLAHGTYERQSGKAEEVSRIFPTDDVPDTLVCPQCWSRHQWSPLHSWVEERGVLEGLAFAQCPQLLLSSTPNSKSKPMVLLEVPFNLQEYKEIGVEKKKILLYL